MQALEETEEAQEAATIRLGQYQQQQPDTTTNE